MVKNGVIPLIFILYTGITFHPSTCAFAQSYNLERGVISSGGGGAVSDNFGISSTMGQIIGGIFKEGNHQLFSGFWAVQSLSPSGAIAVPRRFSLYQNYPNPFNSSTQFMIDLPMNGEVDFMLYDILGRSIKKIHSGDLRAGTHTFGWNGKNSAGRLVSSGIYYATFSTPSFSRTIKLTLLK